MASATDRKNVMQNHMSDLNDLHQNIHIKVLSAMIIIVEQINILQVHVHVSIKYFIPIKQS